MHTAVSFVPTDDVARIRSRLEHPIVDGDGHLLEFLPLVYDLVREEAGPDVVARMRQFSQHRFEGAFLPVRVFHGLPAENTVDRMTVTLPELLYHRLDEIGIDYALLYPSFGLPLLSCIDDEVRQAGARALNRYYAEVFDGYRDRLEPVAVIPTFSPEEALHELEHAVVELGLKAIVLNGAVPRSVRPDGTPAAWVDTLGHESLHNYDALWARCIQLGVVPAFHGIGYGWGTRVSSSNYVHNHLGSFAAAQEGVCRSLLMGGVTSRFPDLRLSFLEGGAAWACQLYGDLLGHYAKRNRHVVARYDDARLDIDVAMSLFDKFAHGAMATRRDRMERSLRGMMAAAVASSGDTDDFAEAGFEDSEEIVAAFTNRLFFGCEADDPMNALAFDRRLLPRGGRLNALFASDIGHWDVVDATDVLPEAWELVDDGLLTEEEFSEFTFGNVTRLLTSMNPRFFDGTAIQTAVDVALRR